MKKDIQSIHPLEGLGMLRFGMKRNEVKSLLGEPNDIDEYSFSGDKDELSESWHYDDLDLSMSFDAVDDWMMTTLAISSEFYELDGIKPIGMSKSELFTALQGIGWSDLHQDDEHALDMPHHSLVSSESQFVNFWLEDEIVKEVQWSPAFDDNDQIEWPD